jgi:hypothetical protein
VGEPTKDTTGQHEDERGEARQVSGQQGTARHFYPSVQVTLPAADQQSAHPRRTDDVGGCVEYFTAVLPASVPPPGINGL